jgi:anaerobic selenocysteine-containing dehydrogenase
VIKRAQAICVKVIDVDPRYTSTAAKSDVWLPIRPGSDMAMVLTFINTMITENKFDREFVEKWTNGPFLVNSNGFLLRESDLKKGGDKEKYVVWNKVTQDIAFWDGKKLQWSDDNVKPAIEGSYTVQGKEYKTSFEVFKNSVSEWTPEKASRVTWVDADKIKEAMSLYIQNSPGACFARGQKVEFSVNTSGISHAFTLMMALAGNFDVKGGQNIGREPATYRNSFFFDIIPPKGEVRKHTEANIDDYSVCPGTQKIMGNNGGYGAATTHAMVTGKPFQPRAYWGQTSEPIVGVEDSREVYEGFKKLDFIVNVDLFMTPTGELADIILPAAHPNEVDRIEWAHSGHGWPASHTAQIRQPLAQPVGECRDDIDICFDLAKRMGINMGWKDKYQFFDFVLAPTKMNFEQFRKKEVIVRPPTYKKYETGGMRRDRRPGFQTPNGKFNLYSEDLKKYGWGPLPSYIEPPESPYSEPETAQDYPYVLITGGRSHAYFHCEYRQSPFMREIHTYPTVDINPVIAEKEGIKDGDWVYIKTKHGKCKQRAYITNGISPKIIHCEHDWWFPERDAKDDLHGAFDSNCNAMLSNDGLHDPAIGTNNFGGLCKIEKANDGPPPRIWTTAEQLKGFLPRGGK